MYLEQKPDDIRLPFGTGLVQRREPPQVGGVDAGAARHQQLRDFVVAVRARVVQRHKTTAAKNDIFITISNNPKPLDNNANTIITIVPY